MKCSSNYLVILMLLCTVSSLYANGCYTSIISFGDSLADTGNLKQLAKFSNQVISFLMPPYGESLPDKSTGRCSNGRLVIDFLAESLGLPLIPPYVNDKGNKNAVAYKQGVNYAVAGATALNSSVLEARGIVNPLTNASLEVQLEWFKQSLPSICGNIADCRNLIARSLILVGEIGGNDYNFPILAGKPIDEFKSLVPLVIDSIISAVNELVEMGARTLVIPGNLPIGCSAAYLTVCGSETEEYDPRTGCLVHLNKFAEYHNELLQTKLNRIRELHANVNIIYADYYNAAMQIYRAPVKFGLHYQFRFLLGWNRHFAGFTNGALKACCGGHRSFNFDSSEACGSASAPVCDQPDTYVSWDGIHLTEAAYRLIFKYVFQGPYTTPQFNSLCPTSTLQLGGSLSSSK